MKNRNVGNAAEIAMGRMMREIKTQPIFQAEEALLIQIRGG